MTDSGRPRLATAPTFGDTRGAATTTQVAFPNNSQGRLHIATAPSLGARQGTVNTPYPTAAPLRSEAWTYPQIAYDFEQKLLGQDVKKARRGTEHQNKKAAEKRADDERATERTQNSLEANRRQVERLAEEHEAGHGRDEDSKRSYEWPFKGASSQAPPAYRRGYEGGTSAESQTESPERRVEQYRDDRTRDYDEIRELERYMDEAERHVKREMDLERERRYGRSESGKRYYDDRYRDQGG
jgi:hypothetical protein